MRGAETSRLFSNPQHIEIEWALGSRPRSYSTRDPFI